MNKDFVMYVAASYHTCSIFYSKEAKCWGWNNMGHLGYLDTVNRGDAINTMGNNLNVLAAISPFVKIVTMKSWNCALFESNEVKCWGNTKDDASNIQYFFDSPSDLDFGTNVYARTSVVAWTMPVVFSMIMQSDVGETTIMGSWGLGYHITPSHPNSSFTSVASYCGSCHTFTLLEDRKIYCWGRNQHGQLSGFKSYGNGDILNT